MKGQIVRIIAGFYDVIDLKSQKLYPLLRGSGFLRQNENSPLVGDFVDFKAEGFINKIYERKNQLIRPKVANIDQALVFVSIKKPDFSSLLLDRFLLIIESKNITPILIITKIDLDSNFESWLVDYQKMNYTIFFINNKNTDIPNELKQKLREKLNFVIGQTGVGKTSFINNLLKENLEIQEISQSLNRGKHTTRVVQIFEKDNFRIIDTPGFSSFSHKEIGKVQIRNSFKIFQEFAINCKFRTCFHFQESLEICGIKKAVKEGKIPETRYKNYYYFLGKYEKKNY
ncbi:ribosome small subunit-dependent GTPase A [Mycoplasma flocculare]|uniref:ribosome small subunit-dependent GTPase A n=1 Tax=Mesomycoplasma flocculare TaxID=2128 RepID=UPI00136FE081|nr:ribosome small subunit-dependent GTPase A [Mesomycoplasma flocculare]MXR13464.1 ribosome small subunit-dependent GTPase A [Mesomycoplasma flocculare]MXR22873.1 ribosome small subunit-dependent GTPase A [Mesomycoplasma flocculare]MXR56262.1 ribosome small subunit-dependent GTPase A [Mesomycoplasma flocculare]